MQKTDAKIPKLPKPKKVATPGGTLGSPTDSSQKKGKKRAISAEEAEVNAADEENMTQAAATVAASAAVESLEENAIFDQVMSSLPSQSKYKLPDVLNLMKDQGAKESFHMLCK